MSTRADLSDPEPVAPEPSADEPAVDEPTLDDPAAAELDERLETDRLLRRLGVAPLTDRLAGWLWPLAVTALALVLLA